MITSDFLLTADDLYRSAVDLVGGVYNAPACVEDISRLARSLRIEIARHRVNLEAFEARSGCTPKNFNKVFFKSSDLFYAAINLVGDDSENLGSHCSTRIDEVSDFASDLFVATAKYRAAREQLDDKLLEDKVLDDNWAK